MLGAAAGAGRDPAAAAGGRAVLPAAVPGHLARHLVLAGRRRAESPVARSQPVHRDAAQRQRGACVCVCACVHACVCVCVCVCV